MVKVRWMKGWGWKGLNKPKGEDGKSLYKGTVGGGKYLIRLWQEGWGREPVECRQRFN